MKIFLIPGLGFNKRIFERLDLKEHDVEHISWIEPHQGEALKEYALRMCQVLLEVKEPFGIIGHSLGGIVAQYFTQLPNLHKLILLSTITSRREMPLLFKLVGPLKLYHLFTKELSVRTVGMWGKSHGYETDVEKEVFKSMVAERSNTYLQWALKSLSMWSEENSGHSERIVRIHGKNDKTFPIGLVQETDYIVENGSHIMVYTKAKEVGTIVLNELKES